MKLLITGAGGFLGSNMAKYLSENTTDYEIISVGKNNLHRSLFDKEIYIKLDLINLDHCIEATKKIDYVFDFASIVGGFKFLRENSAKIMYESTLINLNVLEASRINKVKKIMFASSACVYPIGKNECLVEEDAYPINPENQYGLQKIYIENIYKEYQKRYGIKVYLPRFQNVYGPYIQYKGDRAKGLADICRKAIETPQNGEIELQGNGKQIRDYTFSEDVMEGAWKLINSDIHEPINISSGKGITIDEYAKQIIEILKKNVFIKYNYLEDTGIKARVSMNKKANELINWKPKITLKDGLIQMINWIKEDMKK